MYLTTAEECLVKEGSFFSGCQCSGLHYTTEPFQSADNHLTNYCAHAAGRCSTQGQNPEKDERL